MSLPPLPPENRPFASRKRSFFLLLMLIWTAVVAALLYLEGSELRGDHPLLFRMLTASLGSLLLVPLWFVRPRLPRRRGPRRSRRRLPA